MDKKCSLCGNIYKNRVFRGGFICEDCMASIRAINFDELLHEQHVAYTAGKEGVKR